MKKSSIALLSILLFILTVAVVVLTVVSVQGKTVNDYIAKDEIQQEVPDETLARLINHWVFKNMAFTFYK